MSDMKDGNILLVANYSSDVGYAWWLIENYWAEIANHFHKIGKKTYLIFPTLTAVPNILQDAPVTLIEHNFDDVSASGFKNLAQLIKTHSISYIYLTDKPYYSIQYLRLRRAGIKRIVLHDHTPGERTKPNSLIFFIKRILFSIPSITCDKYIGVSYFIYHRLVDVTGIPARKCTYVLNGIQPIATENRDIDDLRVDFHLPTEAVLVVSTGRAVRYKGIKFIIECANQLINFSNIDNVYFFHCGDGPALFEFKQLVRKYKLGSHFFFLGHRTNVRRLLPACDVAFHASKGEAFSLSILEYLSAGLATIVPESCGNAEAVEHNKTGLLYEPENINSAIPCLREVILDPGLRKRLGDKGRQSVKEKFSLKRANKELLSILEGEFI